VKDLLTTSCDNVVAVTGDSGYPLEPWLMTPITSPTTAAEIAYNSAHSRTRVVIERCFGLLKSRFRCLDKSGGTLLYSAEKVCRLVTATTVLHNFAITRRIPAAIDLGVVERSAAIQPTAVQGPATVPAQSAVDLRRRVIAMF
jgi:DDE superfamily endonuclease